MILPALKKENLSIQHESHVICSFTSASFAGVKSGCSYSVHPMTESNFTGQVPQAAWYDTLKFSGFLDGTRISFTLWPFCPNNDL